MDAPAVHLIIVMVPFVHVVSTSHISAVDRGGDFYFLGYASKPIPGKSQ